MQQRSLLYDDDGNAFHGEGTQIYWDADGQLTYDCPNCGQNWVPRHKMKALAKPR